MEIFVKDVREENERELLALIINKPEYVDKLTISFKYLKNKKYSTLLSYLIECYKQYKFINPNLIYEKHQDVNLDLLIELMTDVYMPIKNEREQFNAYQEKIIEFYKKDIINELQQKLEKNEIGYEEFIKKIKKLDEIKINNISDSMLKIEDIDYKKTEQIEYIKSNIFNLDNTIKGFALSQLSVWSGSNGGAKSTFLNQLAIESVEQGYNVAIYSGELTSKRILNWIIQQCAGKKNMTYHNRENYFYVDNDIKEKICNWLNNKMFIYNNSCGNKVTQVLDSLIESIKKYNIKVIIFDNLMSVNLNSMGDNKYDVQSQLVQELSRIAKEYNVHIHFVCHPRKSTNFLRKVDISGSADLTNIADNVFIMHRVNNDFIVRTKEMFKWKDDNNIYQYTNVCEVCKNRELGVEDYFVGMYFEKESKRLKNYEDELKEYSWNDNRRN